MNEHAELGGTEPCGALVLERFFLPEESREREAEGGGRGEKASAAAKHFERSFEENPKRRQAILSSGASSKAEDRDFPGERGGWLQGQRRTVVT